MSESYIDFSGDYAWSGENYHPPFGLPTIGCTKTNIQKPFSVPSDLPRFAVKQNRAFGPRWHNRNVTRLARSGPESCIDDYNPQSTSYPILAEPRRRRTPRVARPGFYNPLERELYDYLPKHLSGFYPRKTPIRNFREDYRPKTSYY